MSTSHSDNSTSISRILITSFLIGLSTAGLLYMVDWKAGDYSSYYFYLGIILIPVVVASIVALIRKKN